MSGDNNVNESKTTYQIRLILDGDNKIEKIQVAPNPTTNASPPMLEITIKEIDTIIDYPNNLIYTPPSTYSSLNDKNKFIANINDAFAIAFTYVDVKTKQIQNDIINQTYKQRNLTYNPVEYSAPNNPNNTNENKKALSGGNKTIKRAVGSIPPLRRTLKA